MVNQALRHCTETGTEIHQHIAERGESVFELAEVVMYVQNMENEVSFFQEVLGFRVKEPKGLSSYDGVFRVVLDTGGCSLVFNIGGQAVVGEYAPKPIFRVRDLRSVHDGFEVRGAKVGAIRSPEEGIWAFEVVDPEQNKYSFEQHGGRPPIVL